MVARLARWAGRRVYTAPRERTRCPACGSRRLAALAPHRLERAIDGRRTGLVSGCEDCGLVFVNPPPSDDDLAARYAPGGDWGADRDDAERPRTSAGQAGGGSWPRLFDAARPDLDVTHPPAGARALDFGCGRGKFLDVLQACGWQTFGIEPASDAAFDRHQRLLEVPEAPTFDLFIVHHVLEHVADPLALLRRFAAAAQPGAYMLVAVPRLDTLPLHRDYSYVISRVHVTAYTAVALSGLLARAGWAVVQPPDTEVAIAGGRQTSARLRLLARRTPGLEAAALPAQPLGVARAALRTCAPRYPRLAARVIESRRWVRQHVTKRLDQAYRRY
ncbi:MAG: class I SAM-dependent methyltransferase [Vicinamibacterales bacterium]